MIHERLKMHTISMRLANLANKPHKEQISNAGGLLIVSPQTFANFMADSTYTKHIHVAIASGVEAAKQASQIFTMCYQIALQSIDIEIHPTDSIHTDTMQYYTNFLPSFKPKHFSLGTDKETKIAPQPHNEVKSNMRMRFDQAITKFQDKQAQFDRQHTKVVKMQGHCGFEVNVCIKANAQVAPDMESMYALQTTLLSLFGIFKHDEMAVIAQMRLTR